MDYERRRITLRERAGAAGVGVIAVAPGANMKYLLGYHPHIDERPCYLILAESGEALLVPALNASEVASKVELPMQTYADEEGPQAAMSAIVERLRLGAVRRAMVEETMRYDFVLEIARAMPSASMETSEPLLGAMRMRKDADEIEEIRLNAAMADRVLETTFNAMRPGQSEDEIAAAVRDAFAAEGAERTNFAIIASGPNGAFPHHASSSRRVKIGDAVVVDIGAHHRGYNSDITRMAFLGKPDAEYLKVHRVVDAAVEAALSAIHPGALPRDIDGAARRVIEDAGYGDYFTHRVGHGLGITGHEPPYITGTNPQPLEVGMTFSVEPGVYLPGRFGVRLEEIVLVTEDRAEVLSRVPRDVRTIQG